MDTPIETFEMWARAQEDEEANIRFADDTEDDRGDLDGDEDYDDEDRQNLQSGE